MTGIIIKALSGFYYVFCDNVIYQCKARGSFRKSGISPLVCDRVDFEATEDYNGRIVEIFERRNHLERPPVANIDKLFIVSSFENPSPNTLVIDKMTVIAKHNNIEPVIVFNKSDMGDFTYFQKIYQNAGFKTYVCSAETGDGMDELQCELQNSVSAFTGNSGVGKSSILNYILGNSIIETGEISQKLGRGRHTTRHTQAYALTFGGFVVDTPGFSSLDVDSFDYSLKENLPDYFNEFSQFSKGCKFTGCTHTKETGCAVINALNQGKIEATRHNSYIEIFEQLKDLKPWNCKKNKFK